MNSYAKKEVNLQNAQLDSAMIEIQNVKSASQEFSNEFLLI